MKSNFQQAIDLITKQNGLFQEQVSDLLGSALQNYGKYSSRHTLNFSFVMEVWERDCSNELTSYHLDFAA